MKQKCKYFFVTFWYSVIFLSFSSSSYTQPIAKYERPVSAPLFLVASQDTFPQFINEDSLIAATLSPVDTITRDKKSTTIAMLSSMIIPGAGQLYNGSYWKVPIVVGYSYYFFSVYRDQNRLYKESKLIYEQELDSINLNTDKSKLKNLQEYADYYKGVRDFYKAQRNQFATYLAITYILNILDAYVDAALYNFEVTPNLQGTSDWRMNLRIRLR